MAEYIQLSPKSETATDRVVDPVLADVREEWVWVKPGVEEILKVDPKLTFRPEDVYAACVMNQAQLWVASEGFVVTSGETDPFTNRRTLVLWLAWAFNRGTDMVSKYQNFFGDLARQTGYVQLETRSAVRELQGHLTTRGWDVNTVVYTRRV